LSQSKQIRPQYAESFRCIGSACEDTCCQGWNVPIDRDTFASYLNLPASPLRAQIVASIQPAPAKEGGRCADLANGASGFDRPGGPGPGSFATIQMNAAKQCPLLSEDRLCRIHAELGEEFLSRACTTYPRIVYAVEGVEERVLALSCPEAARLVLLSPDLLAPVERPAARAGGNRQTPVAQPENGAPLGSSAWGEGGQPLLPWFWTIREMAVTLVRNRAYLLWQRLFLLGVFCKRLNSIAKGELKRSVPAFLGDFEASVASGGLRAAMESLPLDNAAQLDAVLRLAGMMLHRANVGARFEECAAAFSAGIGNGPGATLESLAAHYAAAHDRYYEPFMRRSPHIVENYLINTIFRGQFPFGREGMRPGAEPSLTREYALLTAQFALMKGLLIGVAGFHREAFSSFHAVHTVQAASKHFEHHPEFLSMAHSLLVESGLDGARGLAILLRNSAPGGASGEARPASPGRRAPGPQDGRWASTPHPAQAPGPRLQAPPPHPHGEELG
jgi:lysine-N-methylase